MVNHDTLLLCDIVLRRYLDVLAEHPECTTPEFRAMVSDAAADVSRARNDAFMNLSRAVKSVPTETDLASLLSPIAKGSDEPLNPSRPAGPGDR